MAICHQNLYHTQKLQKQTYNKEVKPQSYALGNNVWLRSKHLKTMRNCKLKTKSLCFFRVLYLIGKQAYKLKLPKKWKIHNVFHVSLLEQDTTKKGQVNYTQLDFEFKASHDEEYKVDGIWNSAIYAKKWTTGQLPGLYYLVLWKSYSKEENTWEPALAIQQFQKLTTAYQKNNLKKPIATFLPIDMGSSMARPIPALTKKCGRHAKSTTTTITTKWAKKS